MHIKLRDLLLEKTAMNDSCKYHVCLVPCAVIQIHTAAMHIKKMT